MTEKDIKLYPNLLDIKINYGLVIVTVTDTDEEQKIVIGVQLSRFDRHYNSTEQTNIMKEFIKNNSEFKHINPVVVACKQFYKLHVLSVL